MWFCRLGDVMTTHAAFFGKRMVNVIMSQGCANISH